MSILTEDRSDDPVRSLLTKFDLTDMQSGVWLVLLAVMVLGWILVGPDFVSGGNMTNMMVRAVPLGIVAMGQTLVILGGSLDLSVAYLISVVTVLSASVMDGDPNNIPLAIAVALAVGVGVGLVNGLLVTKGRANPLIVTLGTGLVMKGLLSSRFAAQTGSAPREFQILGYGRIGGWLPLSVLLLLAVFMIAWWMTRSTRFGYHLYSVGGSKEIARLSGVRDDRVIIGAHVWCSVTAAITGIFLVARLGAGSPWVGPEGVYDLESIAAVVVGGTALLGGRGGVPGTLAGVLLLAVLDNMFNALQVDGFLKSVLRGVIIIAAVASYALRSKRKDVDIA